MYSEQLSGPPDSVGKTTDLRTCEGERKLRGTTEDECRRAAGERAHTQLRCVCCRLEALISPFVDSESEEV